MKRKGWWLGWFVLVVIGTMGFFIAREKTQTQLAAEENPRPQITILKEASNSEGNQRITGLSETEGEKTKYIFSVVSEPDNSSRLLFEVIADKGETFTIPFNSWSPDNKYVFIQGESWGKNNYYVLKTDGDGFGEDLKYLDVGKYWEESNKKQIISQVSGWAGPDLLMVYTKDRDGTKSTAFWFVISSRKFMQVREF